MFTRFRAVFLALLVTVLPAMSIAQGTAVPFGGLKHDSSQTVEVTADKLQVNQDNGSAVFIGNVVIGQGTMRLSANKVVVEYTQGANRKISKLHATGNVILVNGTEAAEASEAVYTIDNGNIVMIGNVILTQGQTALSSQRMVVDLKTGKATLEGRVKTILQTGGN